MTAFTIPMIVDELAVSISLMLDDLTPNEGLDCQEPESVLVESIAIYGCPPLLVCPDPRYPEKFYPIDGKRRTKALRLLQDADFHRFGDPIQSIPIPVQCREDLTPSDETAYRLAFLANNARSDNPITDANAIKSAAKSLGVDPFTKEGRSAIAEYLHITPGQVGKLAKRLLVAEAVFEAYRQGDISESALNAVMRLKSERDRKEVAKRIAKGEKLSSSDVLAYNYQQREAAQIEAAKTVQQGMNFLGEANPLMSAIDLLRGEIEDGRVRIGTAREILTLLEGLL